MLYLCFIFCFTRNFYMLYWCKDCKNVIRDKFLQSRLFFFGRCKLPPEIKEPFLEFRFGVSVSRKILYIYKIFLFRKHNKFFGVSISWSIRDFSCGGFFIFWTWSWKVQPFFSGNIRRDLFWENIRKAFSWENIKKLSFQKI